MLCKVIHKSYGTKDGKLLEQDTQEYDVTSLEQALQQYIQGGFFTLQTSDTTGVAYWGNEDVRFKTEIAILK